MQTLKVVLRRTSVLSYVLAKNRNTRRYFTSLDISESIPMIWQSSLFSASHRIRCLDLVKGTALASQICIIGIRTFNVSKVFLISSLEFSCKAVGCSIVNHSIICSNLVYFSSNIVVHCPLGITNTHITSIAF